MSQNTIWLGQYDQLDPQRVRVREEIRRQAVRDATTATDAVRADLRQKLTSATRKAESKSTRAQRTGAQRTGDCS